jgi:hypothetical protein
MNGNVSTSPPGRIAVANEVLAIVQRFAGAPIEPSAEAGVAEQAVRYLAPKAESRTIDGQVVSSALDYLLDDYLRILRRQQADAFDSASA